VGGAGLLGEAHVFGGQHRAVESHSQFHERSFSLHRSVRTCAVGRFGGLQAFQEPSFSGRCRPQTWPTAAKAGN
jgi:hypothetical protein